jgi:hypothetical protein
MQQILVAVVDRHQQIERGVDRLPGASRTAIAGCGTARAPTAGNASAAAAAAGTAAGGAAATVPATMAGPCGHSRKGRK